MTVSCAVRRTWKLLEEVAGLDSGSDRSLVKGGVVIAYLIYGCVPSFPEAAPGQCGSYTSTSR